MRFEQLSEHQYLLVFQTGDRFAEELLAFGRSEDLAGATFTGIGAFQEVTVAFFNTATHQYDELHLNEQLELLSVTGNLARFEGDLRLHAHVVLARPDASALGGHLMEGTVRPTLELSLTHLPSGLTRQSDDEFGIPLLAPGS